MSASFFARAILVGALALAGCAPSQPLTPPAPAAGMPFDQLRLESWPELAIAPGGSRIAFVVKNDDPVRPHQVFVTEVGGATALLAQLEREPIELRWTADGAALLYFHEGRIAEGKLPMSTGLTLYKLGLTGAPSLVAESELQPGKLTVGPNTDLLALRGTAFDARPTEPIRLFQPSTGKTATVSEKETWVPVFRPDGGAIAFFERDGDAESLVLYTWASGDRRVIPLGASSVAFSELAWQADGQGVTVYTGDREHTVRVRSFKVDGTAGAERTFALPAKEGDVEVAYDLSTLSPDGKRAVVARQTAQIKRDYRPDVIVDDPLSADVVVDTEAGAVLKALDRHQQVLGWLDGSRVLTQRFIPFPIADRTPEDGRLGVVALP